MLEHKLDVNRLEEAGTHLKLLPFEQNARMPLGSSSSQCTYTQAQLVFTKLTARKKIWLFGNYEAPFSAPVPNT